MMGGIVVRLRLGMGWKEESNGWMTGRSATVFLGLMYMIDPFVTMPAVSRISHMKGAVVKTMWSWATFLEAQTQQKVYIPKTLMYCHKDTWGIVQDHTVRGEVTS